MMSRERLQTAPLREAEADRLATALRVLAEPARLRLLSIIGAAPAGETCVCEFTVPMGLSQPTVSHHLKVLARSRPGRPRATRQMGLLLDQPWAARAPARRARRPPARRSGPLIGHGGIGDGAPRPGAPGGLVSGAGAGPATKVLMPPRRTWGHAESTG